MLDPDHFNTRDVAHLPGHLGLKVVEVGQGRLVAELAVATRHLAINGYLHAGTVITLADTAAGYGCMANLPPGAHSFTTIELKSNLVSTATEGVISCTAQCVHAGKTTQIWESLVTSRQTGKTIARFSCTQLILYPK